MENKKNIIDRVLVEINTNEIKNANTLKNNIRLFLEQEVIPTIESFFDKLNMQQKIVRLENVSIDFEVNVKDDLITFNSAAVSLLENQLIKINEKIGHFSTASKTENLNVMEVSIQENLEEIFLFFLERGYYPWYGGRSQIEEFIKEEVWAKSLNNEIFINKLEKTLKVKKVFQRFVYQYPLLKVFSIISKVAPTEIETHILGNDRFYHSPLKTIYLNTLFILQTERKEKVIIDYLTDWVNQLYENNSRLGFDLNRNILKSIPGSVINNSQIQNLLNKMLDFKSDLSEINTKNEASFRVSLEKEIPASKSLINKDNKDIRFFGNNLNEIRVQNAGLVILHPFLKQLFSTLKFLDKQNQILSDKQNKAVQLLHFISTGKEEFWEGDMVFEKFLCGVPLNFPTRKESILNTEMKQEAENLLIEVVKKWSALKNTSTDGLRQLFFQREGKLIKRERNYKLIVERKAQDVLLDKLDWNLSLIRIPWMKKAMLYVEW